MVCINIDRQRLQQQDEALSLQLVEQLQASGIAASDVQKLKDAGICTVESVMYTSSKDLLKIKGISEVVAEKITEAASKLVLLGFASARVLQPRHDVIVRITTGSAEIDRILKGGIETGCIIGLSGESEFGKTQLCHTLCITCQLPLNQGGVKGRVMYIDADGTFRIERLFQIANRFKLKDDDVLDNVWCATAYTTDNLLQLLRLAASMISETRYAVVIIDGAARLYRAEYSGRGGHSARKAKAHLSKFMESLRKLAVEYRLAVITTNNVVSQTMRETNDMTKILTRLSFKRGREGERTCKVISSPCLEEAEVNFQVREGGISDSWI